MRRAASVLHVIATADFEGKAIVHIVENFARHADPRRYCVSVVLLNAEGPLSERLRQVATTVTAVQWAGGWTHVAGSLRFMRAVRDLRPDIVHLHAGGISTRLAARIGGAHRIVVHFHSLEEESGRRASRSSIGADLVIANSEATAMTVKGSKTLVVHPGVRVLPRRVPRHSADMKTLTVGVVARLAPVKGLRYLLDAAAILKAQRRDVVLEIVGAGADRQRLHEEVQSLGISDIVRFLGWRDDVTSLMTRWDIYVQPSLAEGFGVAVVEAMAAGLPVVATSVGGLTEIVLDRVTGFLVPPRDGVALSACVGVLIDNRVMRSSMGETGRERAALHFSLEQEASAIQAAYDRLLA